MMQSTRAIEASTRTSAAQVCALKTRHQNGGPARDVPSERAMRAPRRRVGEVENTSKKLDPAVSFLLFDRVHVHIWTRRRNNNMVNKVFRLDSGEYHSSIGVSRTV